jgi:DNA transformation protein
MSVKDKEKDNDKLRNVGPKSAAWLRQVGIRTQTDLETAGSVAAFIKVKRAGFRPSLNLLYALEGALLGCHWQQVPEARRTEMLQEAEAASALLPLPKNKRKPIGGEVRDVTPVSVDADGGEAMLDSGFGLDDPARDDEAGGGEQAEHADYGGGDDER